MNTGPTYYKPTQWRGKRVVFASIDPAERTRQTRMAWVAFSVFAFLMIVVGWLVS